MSFCARFAGSEVLLCLAACKDEMFPPLSNEQFVDHSTRPVRPNVHSLVHTTT
jgi:hypothetical protein